jgi:hypothetical protein
MDRCKVPFPFLNAHVMTLYRQRGCLCKAHSRARHAQVCLKAILHYSKRREEPFTSCRPCISHVTLHDARPRCRRKDSLKLVYAYNKSYLLLQTVDIICNRLLVLPLTHARSGFGARETPLAPTASCNFPSLVK